MKKILFFGFFTLLFTPAVLADSTPSVNVFVREGCAHCAAEEEFLATLETKTTLLDISEPQNRALFEEFTAKYGLSRVTPITMVGNEIIIGFSANIGEEIKRVLKTQRVFYTFADALDDNKNLCIDIFGAPSKCANTDNNPLKNFRIPLIGTVDLTAYALPSLSAILGLIDGFNPCAMWVLVTFLIALIQIGDRFKMFLTAGIFIFAEAVMYTLILTVWMTAWDFTGFSQWVTLAVGLVAIGAGGFFLYEGFYSDGTCKVTNAEQRKKISVKIHELTKNPITIGFFLGLIALAFSVNIIEFACSIGIPQTFTLILQGAAITLWQKIVYIAIYIFFYMVDDLIVFGIALYSIEKIGITHKYSRASNVIGGVLMLILGALLIFAPQILAF